MYGSKNWRPTRVFGEVQVLVLGVFGVGTDSISLFILSKRDLSERHSQPRPPEWIYGSSSFIFRIMFYSVRYILSTYLVFGRVSFRGASRWYKQSFFFPSLVQLIKNKHKSFLSQLYIAYLQDSIFMYTFIIHTSSILFLYHFYIISISCLYHLYIIYVSHLYSSRIH